MDKGWSWIWAECDGIPTNLKVFWVHFHHVLHNGSGWSLRSDHQFGLSMLQSGVLEFPLVCYCRGPKLCHLFPLPVFSRPPLAHCSCAGLGQAAVGCVQELQGALLGAPLLCLAAACQLHPHHHCCYGAGVSTCCFLFCRSSPCYSPGRAPLRGWQTLPALYPKWRPGLADAQAPRGSGHLIPRAWVTPSCLTQQHIAAIWPHNSFPAGCKRKYVAEGALMAHNRLGMSATALKLCIILCPYNQGSCPCPVILHIAFCPRVILFMVINNSLCVK